MRIALTDQQARQIIRYNSAKWGLLEAPKEVMVYRDKDGVYLNPTADEVEGETTESVED